MNFYDNIKKWPIKIRVYPEPKSSALYALCHIWPSQKVMISEVNRFPYMAKEYYKINQDVLATTLPLKFTYKETRRVSPLFAHIHFCPPFLTEYFISHELLHAAIAWAHRINLAPDFMLKESTLDKKAHDIEERFCGVQSGMVLQLTSRLEKLGLYK